MIKYTTIKISYTDLKISTNTIYRKLNYKLNSIPDEFNKTVVKELKHVKENFEAKAQFFTTSDFVLNKKLIIKKQNFDLGIELMNILQNSDLLSLFIVSAGNKISERNIELNKSGKILEAYANDIIGNIVAEKTADYLLKYIKNKYPKYKTTNRYSPGNCGWNQMNQKGFFSLFPKSNIGVTLSQFEMMYPIKSLNGIIGLGQRVVFKANTCVDCPSENCLYRKN